MNKLHSLCWGLDGSPENRARVFCERDINVPTELPVLESLEGPKVGIESPLGLSKIVRQKFLDIGQHPAYKVAFDSERQVPGLLPCGVDNILVLPAYERILERAETLSRRYPTSTLRPPPIRNMIVSGVPGIGKESCQFILLMLISG